MNFSPVVALAILTVSTAAPQQITHVDSSTPRETQMQIAKGAAPKEVSDHADVYILGAHGYELAQHGDNGFSCLIDRERPDVMGPECFDAEGSATTVKARLYLEEQRAKGVSEQEIERAIKQGYKSGKFRAPSKPGIVYMLSDSNFLRDPESKRIVHVPAHLMFYAPYATEKTIGSGEGAPYIVNPGEPDALLIVVPAGHATQ